MPATNVRRGPAFAHQATLGSERQLYGVTEAGLRMLSVWMDVVAEERSALDAVLKRYDNLPSDDEEPA